MDDATRKDETVNKRDTFLRVQTRRVLRVQMARSSRAQANPGPQIERQLTPHHTQEPKV